MIPLTLGEIAAITGGALCGGAAATTLVGGPVVIDSRSAAPGALFVAVAGERADGHDFAARAARAGAVAALATRPVDAPAVLVADVQAALGQLARAVVDRLPEVVIAGVTGSSGKTTTKDILGQLAARLGPTVAAVGSYNNEIGHPLTVLRVQPDTRYLILELSARDIGHIAHLCRIAPPKLGAVLNVGSAHLGAFGSAEAVARAKGELVAALPADGVAVLNADDPNVAAMAGRTTARVVTFGRAPGADVRAADVTLDDDGRPAFTLTAGGVAVPVRLPLLGAFNVANALAAAALAAELGMGVEEIGTALGEIRPLSRWRMERRVNAGGVLVINDAYNANPEAVSAALDTLAALARGRRAHAVLGLMNELGADSALLHERIGRKAAGLGLRTLVVVGEGAAAMAAGAAASGFAGNLVRVADADEAIRAIRPRLRRDDVVLVKASRVVGLERVAAALLDGTEGTEGTDGAEGTAGLAGTDGRSGGPPGTAVERDAAEWAARHPTRRPGEEAGA